MIQRHEFCICKVILDYPDTLEDVLARGITPSTVEEPILREVLASGQLLLESKVKPNRDNLISFIDLVDAEEKEDFADVLVDVDTSGGVPENLESHIQEVLAWSFRVKVREALTKAFNQINTPEDVNTIVKEFHDTIVDLQSNLGVEEGSIADWVEKYEDHIRNLPDEADMMSQLFGLPSLDEVRGRDPHTGELILIAAGPKVGKSSLANNIVISAIDREEPLGFLSGEMAGKKTYQRALAGYLGMSSRLVDSKAIFDDPTVKARYDEKVKKLKRIDNIFVDFKNLSVPYVRNYVYKLYRKYGVKTFIFDRIGLFAEVDGKDEFRGRRKVTRGLRNLCNELPDIKIILCSQLVNEVDKGSNTRPKKHHVFGGNGGQADCTSLYLIYRPFHTNPMNEQFEYGPWEGRATVLKGTPYSFAEIYCPLNSNGASNGTAYVVFDSEKQMFTDLGQNKFVLEDKDYSEEIARIAAGTNTFDSDGYVPEDDPDVRDGLVEPTISTMEKPKRQAKGVQSSGKDLLF
jgi:replicative DNA helicase